MKELDKLKSGKNVYVGHRYVPKLDGDWDNSKTYEALTIVQYQGNSFTSRQNVPSGVDISNKEFWVLTGNYNVQLANKIGDGKKAELEDLSPTVLSAIEGGEGTSFNLLTIPQDKSVTPEKTTFLKKINAGKNLYNADDPDIISGMMLNPDDTMTSNASFEITGYIPVKAGNVIHASRSGGSTSPMFRTWCIYDPLKVFISGEAPANNGPVTITHDGYIRVTHNKNDTHYQLEVGTQPTSYEPYREIHEFDESMIKKNTLPEFLTPLKGKTLVVNGDSIMAGQFPANPTGYETPKYMYIQQVADTLGMALINNAIGGSTVAVSTTSPNERNPLVERYQSMPDGDLVIISIGTNDWANNWTEIGDMLSRSNNTFYGALHNLCLGLIEKYDVDKTQIVLMTPIKRSYGTVLSTPESTNVFGKTLSDYAEMIKEVGGYYGIPVIDMYNECSLNPYIESQKVAYVPDGTHPNTEGHTVIARRVIGYLKQLV